MATEIDPGRRPSRRPDADDPHCPAADPAEAVSALVRQTVEFLVVLSLGILLFRTFAAEAYIVPTGSMAPTLRRASTRTSSAPNCGFRYRPRHRRPRADGPSGLPELRAARARARRVGRVERRPAARAEVPVRPPAAPALGGRGLPEPGRAEPGLRQARRRACPARRSRSAAATSTSTARSPARTWPRSGRCGLVVYDNNFVPADADRFPRWAFRRGRQRLDRRPAAGRPTGRASSTSPRRPTARRSTGSTIATGTPTRGRYGPVRDFVAYNGGDVRGENVVRDLMLEAKVSARPDAPSLVVRVDSGSDFVLVTLPVDGRAQPEVRSNGKLIAPENVRRSLASSPAGSATVAAAGGRRDRPPAAGGDRRLARVRPDRPRRPGGRRARAVRDADLDRRARGRARR